MTIAKLTEAEEDTVFGEFDQITRELAGRDAHAGLSGPAGVRAVADEAGGRGGDDRAEGEAEPSMTIAKLTDEEADAVFAEFDRITREEAPEVPH